MQGYKGLCFAALIICVICCAVPMLCCAMLRCAELHVPCHSGLYYCHTVQCNAMPCHDMPCGDMPCYAMLCLAMPCLAMLRHAALRHVMPCHSCAVLGHCSRLCWIEPCSVLYTDNNYLDGNSWIQFNQFWQSLRCQPAAENPLRVGLQLLQHLLLLGRQQWSCKGLLQQPL